MPVVSPKASRSAPSLVTRSTIAATWDGGTSPVYGQPKLVATITSTVPPAPCTRSINPAMSSSDSAVDRLRLALLCASLAETTTSSSVNPAASARSAPRVFGTSAE
jgi:hypothetical protein